MSENTVTENITPITEEEFVEKVLPQLPGFEETEVEETEETETEDTGTELSLEELIAEILGTEPAEGYTPYAIHTAINGIFKALETGIEIRPQMMYNYDRNGLIVKGQKGKKRYTKEEAVAFVNKYTAKRI